MKALSRIRNVARGILQRYAPFALKSWLWNREYRSGHWNHISNDTRWRALYDVLSKYGTGGRLLDLGCGSGQTAMELPFAVAQYVGVDISAVAIGEARARLHAREGYSFAIGDIASYRASSPDVIMFRESLYYLSDKSAAIEHYARLLAPNGVFVVTLHSTATYPAIIAEIRRHTLLEEIADGARGIFVFQPKARR